MRTEVPSDTNLINYNHILKTASCSEKPVPENLFPYLNSEEVKNWAPWGMNIDIRSIKTLVNTTKFQLKYPVQISPNTTSIMGNP